MGFITHSQFSNGLTAAKNYIDEKNTELSERVATTEGLLDGHSVGIDVPSDAKFTDTVYDDATLQGDVASITQRVSANETAISDCYTKQETDTKIDEILGDINTLLSAI